MTDMLATGMAWLSAERHAHLTRAVTYIRSSIASLTPLSIQASVGRSPFQVVEASGAVHEIQSRDYLVRAADLLDDGETFLPAIGDEINEATAAGEDAYEVVSIAGEPCYRKCPPDGLTIRIHTQRVGEQK